MRDKQTKGVDEERGGAGRCGNRDFRAEPWRERKFADCRWRLCRCVQSRPHAAVSRNSKVGQRSERFATTVSKCLAD